MKIAIPGYFIVYVTGTIHMEIKDTKGSPPFWCTSIDSNVSRGVSCPMLRSTPTHTLSTNPPVNKHQSTNTATRYRPLSLPHSVSPHLAHLLLGSTSVCIHVCRRKGRTRGWLSRATCGVSRQRQKDGRCFQGQIPSR